MKEADIKSDVAGHRDRLREKFRKSRLAGFNDYEIVEMLLIFGTPRRDTKQAAKDAIKRFGSLRGVIEASIGELEEVPGIGRVNAIAINFIRDVARAYLKDKVTEPKSVKSSQEVYEYLKLDLSGLKKEVFKVLFLDSQNHVLAVEDLSTGTVNSSPVLPREVIERALQNRAVSLIFVHNHPSGNPDPSQSDKDLTRDLVFAANAVGIKVLDHIIVGSEICFSFAGHGMIEQSELLLLNNKSVNQTGKIPKGFSGNSAGDGLPWGRRNP
jgi:DNA repair protein RadC